MKYILAVTLLALCTLGAAAQDAPSTLTVAFIDHTESGALYLWHEGQEAAQRILEGAVQNAALSPDGQHLTYFRDHELWLIDADGQNAHRLPDYAYYEVRWRDATHLVFTTAGSSASGMRTPYNDLWQLDITEGAALALCAPGECGTPIIPPGGAHIVVSRPGSYGDPAEPAALFAIDPTNGARTALLSYPSVSTASQYAYVPALHWTADGDAFRVAIPHPDLVYATPADAPPVALWEIDMDGEAQQIGTAPADYFSVLFNDAFWSPGGNHIAYGQRSGAPTDNLMLLCFADTDGSHPSCPVEGDIRALSLIGWLSDDVYSFYQDDSTWTMTPGGAPEPNRYQIDFGFIYLNDGVFVYLERAEAEGAIYLRYARSGEAPHTIARLDARASPTISAVLVAPEPTD